MVLGLLSDLPRKNCWAIAEWAGDRAPDGMQHLHADEAVLVVDETGDVKKGTDTVGVQRQCTGTAGRIEDAQVAVYLVYADRRGHGANTDPADFIAWIAEVMGPSHVRTRQPASAGAPGPGW